MKCLPRILLIGSLLGACVPGALRAQRVWHLVEDLRIGNAPSGAAAFNELYDLTVDKRANVFVFDARASEIREFDSTGRFVRLFGRTGEGPGEFAPILHGIQAAPDGKLWANDAEHDRLVVFNADGSFDRQFVRRYAGFSLTWDARFDTLGRLMEVAPTSRNGQDAFTLFRLDPRNAAWDVVDLHIFAESRVDHGLIRWQYRTASGGGTIAIPFAPRPLNVLDPGGRWWISAAMSYQLRLVAVDHGNVVANVAKVQARQPIPRAVRDSSIRRLSDLIARIPAGTISFDAIPKTYPSISALAVDDRDNLWVMHETGPGPRIDVWSPDGTPLATLDGPVGTQLMRIVVIRGDHLYTIALDRDDIPSVVRYRIVRKP
jgi:hypothetical protein